MAASQTLSISLWRCAVQPSSGVERTGAVLGHGAINDVNDNPVVTGIALKTGIDLLGQFAYLNFGGSLYVQTDFDPLADPNYQNLGSTSHLYFVVAPV